MVIQHTSSHCRNHDLYGDGASSWIYPSGNHDAGTAPDRQPGSYQCNQQLAIPHVCPVFADRAGIYHCAQVQVILDKEYRLPVKSYWFMDRGRCCLAWLRRHVEAQHAAGG